MRELDREPDATAFQTRRGHLRPVRRRCARPGLLVAAPEPARGSSTSRDNPGKQVLPLAPNAVQLLDATCRRPRAGV
jgi:hypothetical protein